ncbi:glycosyl hydrolase [Methylobacterium sp. Leaf108]|uniref:glycosyl hydrolase n=1 Tax=Methylobacterium sp. Leaf108 TaxID=1736256 RepID=UPI0009E77453|nr:glycosyl hydrolase [Methylobacterium sp. Leaf108]
MLRLALPLLGSTLLIASYAMSQAQTSTVTAGPGGVSSNTTMTNKDGKPCRVVHSDESKNTGNLSSSVTAGPGGVQSSTTGGPSVTTHSSNGQSSSSSSSGSSSSSSNGTTMTTTSDGDCVVTTSKDKK